MERLRALVGIGVGLAAGARVGLADRLHGHRSGRGDVLIEECGRRLQHVGDVVEAIALSIRREQLGRIQLQPEQVINGIRVFFSIQPVKRDVPRVRVEGYRRVQIAFHPRHERVRLSAIRTSHARRRHHATAQLTDHLFPNLRVPGNTGGI